MLLQVNSTLRFEDAEAALASAARHHGASILAVTDLGRLLHPDWYDAAHDAQVFTICQSELYSALLAADLRFAALLPCRIAVIRHHGGAQLESFSPREFCHTIHRPDLDRLAGPLEDALRQVMEEAANPSTRPRHEQHGAGGSSPGATEMQMNMRAAIPQRIDCHGTKVEDLAGTGSQDAPGG
jgi:uncharacterized protein (DUF302 family)